MSADYPDLPYVHARGDGGPRPTTQVIIIHATDNTAPATNEASYATRREDSTSAHYYVDDNTTIQALPIGNIAYGALFNGNRMSVQYELCGRSNQLTDATIRRAATQVARDCARYGIPARKLTPAQVRAGQKGICGHGDITAAFPEDGGNHTDPGASFPWTRFIGYVAGQHQEDSMACGVDSDGGWAIYRIEAIARMYDRYSGGPEAGVPVPFVAAMKELRAMLAELKARPTAQVTLSVADRDAIVNALVGRLGELIPAIAVAVAEEDHRRSAG